jgi:hypothetical protein
METVIAVVALLFVLFVAVGIYAAVKVVGAAKRGVDRTLTQAKQAVEDSTLRARSYAQPGPAGELAQLRLRLRTSMRATQDALRAKVATDESLKESLSLFERLSVHGHELDDELRRLESEPDRAALADRLRELRARTRRITEAADSLRWAARDRAHRFADDDLDHLSTQIDVEAGALRHWAHDQEQAQPQPQASPTRPGSGGSGASWPQPPVSEAERVEQTWPPPSQGAPEPGGQDATQPAIAPHVGRPTYPWQKKTRRENTT